MSEMTVEDAEQEAREAEALAVELEERVRQGDPDVTADQIAEAERLGRFARLRVEAATRKATERRRAAAVEHAEAFKTRLLEEAAANDADVVKAWSGVVSALRKLQAAADERWALVNEQVDERAEVGQRLRTEAGVELTDMGVLPGRYNRDGYQIPEKGIDVRQAAIEDLIGDALAVALTGNVAARVKSTGTPAGDRQLADLPLQTTLTGVVGLPDAARKELEKRGIRR
jgi:hypothetical protein